MGLHGYISCFNMTFPRVANFIPFFLDMDVEAFDVRFSKILSLDDFFLFSLDYTLFSCNLF